MHWANFFHIYQPPHWSARIIRKVAREAYRPFIRFLLTHPSVRLTLNISGSLTEQLAAIESERSILVGIRKLLARRQIELTDSAMYHALLPLLPDHEIIRQIQRNHQVNRRAFGPAYRPTGFFPPEMAYSPKLGRIISQLGYRWIILDGICHPNIVDYTIRSSIRSTSLTAIFRNRYISDYLAFVMQESERKKFIQTAKSWSGQSHILVTAMDGENLGHHRPEAKHLWQSLVGLPGIQTITLSELIELQAPQVSVAVRSGSWSSRQTELRDGAPFGLWRNPKNELHRLQWRLFNRVLALFERRERRGRIPVSIREAFDQSVASDWYWWASREPWWDVDIVVTAANKLQVLANELEPSAGEREAIDQDVKRVVSTAQTWQANGSASRHAVRFLANEKSPRYLGGERVVYKQLIKHRT